jgi:hypothetical protein
MRSEFDGFSRAGAEQLAEVIVTYWRDQGHNSVRAWPYRFNDGGNDWGVRSNLVAGLPPSPARLDLEQRRHNFLA